MKPLLAHTYEPHRVSFPCYVQPKLNGIRALYQDGCFQSRDELPWNVGILEHIASELRSIFEPQVILDGELYVHGWPLQRINGAVTPVRVGQSGDTNSVEFHIFDRVDYRLSFEDRWETLPHGVVLEHVNFVETRLVKSYPEADAFYSEKVSQGYEGIMYRLGPCPYTVPKQEWLHWFGDYKVGWTSARTKFLSDKNNRTWHLLKRKNWLDDEYICTAFTATVGEKGERGFQLTCKTPNGRFFNCGSGLSDMDVSHYEEHSPVARQVKVKFLCLSEDGIPLNPTILAIL